MGLFSHKYNEKDFKKNTASYKDRINNIMFEYGSQLRGVKIRDGFGKEELVGNVLNKIIVGLDSANLPAKPDWKQLSEIDSRIDGLINQVRSDIQQGKPERLASDVNMLLDAVNSSRNFGQERDSASTIREKQTAANAEATLNDLIETKVKLEAQINAVKAQAKGVPQNTAAYQKLAIQFKQLNFKLAAMDKQINAVQATVMANTKMTTTTDYADVLQGDGMQTVMSANEYAKKAAQTQALEEQKVMNLENINETFEDMESSGSAFASMNSGMDGDLSAALEADSRNAMFGGIDAADASFGGTSADESDDPFANPFGGKF